MPASQYNMNMANINAMHTDLLSAMKQALLIMQTYRSCCCAHAVVSAAFSVAKTNKLWIGALDTLMTDRFCHHS
jgi:hypothetical protein